MIYLPKMGRKSPLKNAVERNKLITCPGSSSVMFSINYLCSIVRSHWFNSSFLVTGSLHFLIPIWPIKRKFFVFSLLNIFWANVFWVKSRKQIYKFKVGWTLNASCQMVRPGCVLTLCPVHWSVHKWLLI